MPQSDPLSIRADLSPQKACTLLKGQLEKLQTLKGRKFKEAQAEEKNWYQFTERIITRSFGLAHANVTNFQQGWYAIADLSEVRGFNNPYVLELRDQKTFEARIVRWEGVLNNCLDELALDMPETLPKGVYEPGEQYEFYRDVKACLNLAQKEIFVIDPYLGTEIFEVYASAIPRTVNFRLLSAKIQPDVLALAQKYAAGGNFAMRSTNAIHDRVLFADNRVWLTGQSLKDAAKKKPTYIVEHDEPLMRGAYEPIWLIATAII